MTVQRIKLAVGIDDVDHLARVQAARVADRRAGGEPEPVHPRHVTRMRPRREAELLDGGSIYWIIKGAIRCRQRILGLSEAVNGAGKPACGVLLDPMVVPTIARVSRPFQGWRYLDPANAPQDAAGNNDDAGRDLPPEMASELRDLGLL